MLHVQCDNCGAWEVTEHGHHPDAVVRCKTGAGDPPGSPEGSCCAVHGSHEEHAEHVRQGGDASCRPVTITVLPGTVMMQPSSGG